MSDYDTPDDFDDFFEIDSDEVVETRDEDGDANPYYLPQLDQINAEALAAVLDHLPIDDQLLRSFFVNLEMLRQTLGAKEELVNRVCGDLESSMRVILLAWAKAPVPMLTSIYRCADLVTQRSIRAQLGEFLAEIS